MRKFFLALSFCLLSSASWAQCNGVFPAKTLCGNLSASPAPPAAVSSAGSIIGPSSSTSGDIVNWANNAGTQVGDSGYTFGTSGATVPLNNGNNFFSGSTSLFIANITSQFQYLGNLITLPNVAATLAYLSGNQTYTGNNIYQGTSNFTGATSQSSAAFTQITSISVPVTVPEGGTGNATATANSIPINNGTSAQTNTGAGATGQCVTGSPPAFVAGCRVLLATLTPTAVTSATDITHITSAFNDYEIVFDNLLPVAASNTCEILVYANSTFQTSTYVAESFQLNSNGGTAETTYIPCSGISTVTSASTATGISGTCRLYNANNTSVYKGWECRIAQQGASTWYGSATGGAWVSGVVAITGFAVQFASGNIAGGIIKLYGLL